MVLDLVSGTDINVCMNFKLQWAQQHKPWSVCYKPNEGAISCVLYLHWAVDVSCNWHVIPFCRLPNQALNVVLEIVDFSCCRCD